DTAGNGFVYWRGYFQKAGLFKRSRTSSRTGVRPLKHIADSRAQLIWYDCCYRRLHCLGCRRRVVAISSVIQDDTVLIKYRFSALMGHARRLNFDQEWFYRFFQLDIIDLKDIALAIDFDLEGAYQNAFLATAIPTSNEFTPRYNFSFDSEKIKEIYRAEERMQEIFPGYRYRPAQEELSLKVGQCFKNNVHALVQAPTGTGKTVGYLLPATLFSLAEKKQVLVSTGTKTLQHQCMSKDVPQLRKILGLDEERLKIKRLVGSNNHL